MGMGYPNTNAYLKTVTAAGNPWINDRAVLDIGAAWVRATPAAKSTTTFAGAGPHPGPSKGVVIRTGSDALI
ncbi:hypothetical protein GGF31_001222 [Allomyces arbusculus]|nr:hypothetical protein GGF31_001222 [Allomyces arbusculus]